LTGVERYGAKWKHHSKDYGKNPGDAEAREWYKSRIAEVRNSHDEVRRGPYNPENGGGSDYWFYRAGDDLLITKGDGTFVTMFPGQNGWYNRAAKIECGCG
jgi:hypothetical protein